MDQIVALFDTVRMAKKAGHFLREWRQFHDLSLEQVAERVGIVSARRADADPDSRALTMTHATLSRIERGKLPYNQHLLECLAEIYRTDPASLIMRDPLKGDPIWSIWDQLAPVQQEQVTEMAKVLKRTGTGG